MSQLVPLLALLRVGAPPGAADRPAHVLEAYGRWLAAHGGHAVDTAPPQLMASVPDAALALESLHALMHEGERYGFTVAAGVVQAIRTSTGVPSSPSDYTERTLATLVEVAGSAGPQQIALTPKLSSLLTLAVPQYAEWLEAASGDDERPVSHVHALLVVRAQRLPAYAGTIRIVAAT